MITIFGVWRSTREMFEFSKTRFLGELNYPKTTFFPGGSDGLGFAIATELVQKGAIVFILSRNQSKLSAAASKLRKYAVPKEFSSNDELSSSLQYKNETVITCQVDLSDLDSVREFIGFYKQKNRRVDILINNAGFRIP